MIVPLIDTLDSGLRDSLSLLFPAVLVHEKDEFAVRMKQKWIIVDSQRLETGTKHLEALLDSGVDKVIIDLRLESQRLDYGVPKERIGFWINESAEIESLCRMSSVVITDQQLMDDATLKLLDSLSTTYDCRMVVAGCDNDYGPAVHAMVRASSMRVGQEGAGMDVVRWLVSQLKSDRIDGFFPTIVTDESGVALGLCYSSYESLVAAVTTGTGVYMSRSRGLWHKGASSGATQKLLSIDWDCDQDTLRFTVIQQGIGFCHLNTRTCFGDDKGIPRLMRLLRQRHSSAPQGSYTKRLFDDQQLLHAKIKEEAQELCDAVEQDDVAWETADLLYFALCKCVASGVSLMDIERHLDLRAKKVSRRPGNAKPQFLPSPVKSDAPTQQQSIPNALGAYAMRVYDNPVLSGAERLELMKRPIIKTDDIVAKVKPIMQQVKQHGDSALIELTLKFDQAKLDSVLLKAPFDASLMQIDSKVKEAIDLAYSNIFKFHEAQLETEPLVVETMPGVVCSRIAKAIEKVGLYVPGGTAILPSSTMMLGIPAKVAGCSEIIIATPPRKDGTVAPEIVYVAAKLGANAILKAGGAQAVAAMAYGTESVPKVDKICGPGNQYVTAAKMVAQSDSSCLLSIDMPAGPSELLVVADASADVRYVVSDLLSQAEHGVDSQVVLVAVNFEQKHLEALQQELQRQACVLPRRQIVQGALQKSYCVQVKSIQEAMRFSNTYAPEHLILNVSNATEATQMVTNAGSVFIGPFSPESCGDYASGTNHTLPTYGYARMYSGVNTHTFIKHITTQELTSEGLDRIGDCVVTLATVEGLDAHRNAVAIRLGDIRDQPNRRK